MLHGKTLHLDLANDDTAVVSTLKALASLPRWRILQYLADGGHTVNQVAHALCIPISTVAAQINILEQAQLVRTELRAASHGLQKVCTRTYDNCIIEFPGPAPSTGTSVEVSMPVGAYTHFEVTPTCGLASASGLIGYLDDPLSFYEPERVDAGLLWFRSGYVEYSFPSRLPPGATLTSVQVSMEICSEAPLHNNNWPSDITVWINGQDVGTWTCPGDFGGQRGRLTPSWWDSKDTQYGLLKRWLISTEGAFIDGHFLSALPLDSLGIVAGRVITVRIGVQAAALHMGGVNLFGHSFGNYPQDLTLRLEYVPGRRSDVP